MGKRLIITEQEKNYIRGKYGLINEQEGNPKECAKKYIEFLLTTTELKDDKKIGGGDLYFWNNNVIPKSSDMRAFQRFLEYLMRGINDNIFQDGECKNIRVPDIIQYIHKYWRETIKNFPQTKNNFYEPDGEQYIDPFFKFIVNLYNEMEVEIPQNVRRRMSSVSVSEVLQKIMMENPPLEPDEEFSYAEDIMKRLVHQFIPQWDYDTHTDAYYELLDYLKDNYGEEVFDYYRDYFEEDDL
jgi:hypothetical protein